MKKIGIFLSVVLFCTIYLSSQAQIAVRGDIMYTMSGDPIKDGIVLLQNGKIEKVGTSTQVEIPEGYEVYSGKVVTPGLVDAHSTVGFSGIYNDQKADQEQLDKSGPIQPELRALDAYNPREELVSFLNYFGVTTVHTGHGPGALISGQTFVVKTYGNTI